MYHYPKRRKINFNAEKSILKSQCVTRTSDNSKYFLWSHRLQVNKFQLYLKSPCKVYRTLYLCILVTRINYLGFLVENLILNTCIGLYTYMYSPEFHYFKCIVPNFIPLLKVIDMCKYSMGNKVTCILQTQTTCNRRFSNYI